MEKPNYSILLQKKSLISFESSNHFYLFLRSTLHYSNTPSGFTQAEPFVSDPRQAGSSSGLRTKFYRLETTGPPGPGCFSI